MDSQDYMKISVPELQIRNEISEYGCISFARFMNLALYHPDGGYYTQLYRKAYTQDFYTSPVTHPSFGALITLQIFHFWELLGSPKNFIILELGSGRGELADVIKHTSRQLPNDFHTSIEYIKFDKLLDPNLEQNQKLPEQITGCILSNELLDSFPVHRFEITNDGPKEICVTVNNDGRLVETLSDITETNMRSYIKYFGSFLNIGSQGEVNLELEKWVELISNILSKGFVLTIDYGYEKSELSDNNLSSGTLQTYRNHCNGFSTLSKIGETDITSDVNFTYLNQITVKHGFNTIQMIDQKTFLESLGFHNLLQRLRNLNIPRRELMQNQFSMLALTSKNGFGEFKVLIHERETSTLSKDLANKKKEFSSDLIEVPLMNKSNIDLLSAKYPHSNWQPTTYESFYQ